MIIFRNSTKMCHTAQYFDKTFQSSFRMAEKITGSLFWTSKMTFSTFSSFRDSFSNVPSYANRSWNVRPEESESVHGRPFSVRFGPESRRGMVEKTKVIVKFIDRFVGFGIAFTILDKSQRIVTGRSLQLSRPGTRDRTPKANYAAIRILWRPIRNSVHLLLGP